MKPDRVLTVNDYYDGPRLGVAELDGLPHVYESEFDHNADEYRNTYFLSPIAPDLLALVLEGWEIWLRWESAYKRGITTLETHPALPEDRARHDELKRVIGDRLKTDPANRNCYRAKFFGPGLQNVEWQPP